MQFCTSPPAGWPPPPVHQLVQVLGTEEVSRRSVGGQEEVRRRSSVQESEHSPGEGGAVAPGPGGLRGRVAAAQPAVVVVRVRSEHAQHN